MQSRVRKLRPIDVEREEERARIEPRHLRILKKEAKSAASRIERENAVAELRETARELAGREFRAKVARFAGNGF